MERTTGFRDRPHRPVGRPVYKKLWDKWLSQTGVFSVSSLPKKLRELVRPQKLSRAAHEVKAVELICGQLKLV